MRSILLLAAIVFAAPCGGAEPSRYEAVLRKLQRQHFMLGVGSAPGDKWIEETKANGCKWDVRYQYICGGVNTPSNWKTWNQPAGAFAAWYMADSDKMGCIPCLTYYQMLQSAPNHGKGGEAQVNKLNCENAATMKAYFDDFKLLLEKAAELKKPVLLHHEPDLWAYFYMAPEFAPNQADKVKVIVKSSGHADVANFDDTAAGFGKALVALRDKYAPNVLLGWHISRWGSPDIGKTLAFFNQCGAWDLFFTDFSDRDAGWKIAKNYMAGGAWWKPEDFADNHKWYRDLFKQSGMPVMAWQVPMGNTVMATCDNTEGHYMDNRPEYFLEDFPKNTRIAEWSEAGLIGLLFGGGAGGCTSAGDARKDGITNPTPIANNKGEKSAFPDDDGGYLRLRGGNYYTKGPIQLLNKTANKPPEPAKPATAAAAPPPAPAVKVDEKVLAAWQEKLVARINAAAKASAPAEYQLRMGATTLKSKLVKADEKGLVAQFEGNQMPLTWKDVPPQDRAAIARALLKDDADVEGLLLAAVMNYAGQQPDAGEDFLAKAAIKDVAAAAGLRKALGLEK